MNKIRFIQLIMKWGVKNLVSIQKEERKIYLPLELDWIKRVEIFDGYSLDIDSIINSKYIVWVSNNGKLNKDNKEKLINKESFLNGEQVLEFTRGMNEKKIEETFHLRDSIFLTGNNGYIYKNYHKIFEDKENLENYVDSFYIMESYLNQFETKEVEIFRFRKYLEQENIIIKFKEPFSIRRKDIEKRMKVISFNDNFFLDEITNVYAGVKNKEMIKKWCVPSKIQDKGTEQYSFEDFLLDNSQFKLDISQKTHYIYNSYFESPEFNERLDGKDAKLSFRTLKPSWKKYIYNQDLEQEVWYAYKTQDWKKILISKNLKKIIIYNPLKGILTGLIKNLEIDSIKERLLTPYREKIVVPLGTKILRGYDETVQSILENAELIWRFIEKNEIKDVKEIESKLYEIFFWLRLEYTNVIEEINKEEYTSVLKKMWVWKSKD